MKKIGTNLHQMTKKLMQQGVQVTEIKQITQLGIQRCGEPTRALGTIMSPKSDKMVDFVTLQIPYYTINVRIVFSNLILFWAT